MFDFFSKKRRLYADYAASTPVRREVLEVMTPYFSDQFANPGSIIHEEGRLARDAIEDARKSIASSLGAKSSEIIFTSGGTEANNLAIAGSIRAFQKRNPGVKAHAITTAIEHPSVLECFRHFESDALRVTYLPVDRHGRASPMALQKAINDETFLVSIMYVNNEIGTVQPIRELGQIIRDKNNKSAKSSAGERIIFHSDASQAPLFYDMHVHNLNIDILTIDGQKIYGPKGVGLLYRASGVKLEPILLGGKQEQNLRPGTENTPLVVGMSRALFIAQNNRKEESKKLNALRDCFISLVGKNIPQAEINGHKRFRSPNNVNISVPGSDAEFLAVSLDGEGIAVGTKSACIDGDISYVVEETTHDEGRAKSTLRFTFGVGTRRSDLDRIVKSLADVLSRGRN